MHLASKLATLAAIGAGCVTAVTAQGRTPQTAPPDPLQVNRNIDDKSRTSDRFESMRRKPEINATMDEERLKVKKELEPLYRKPTKPELALLAPAAEDTEKFRAFLKQNDTGIVRLVPDAACPKDLPLVSATAECMRYTMPGNGSSYSFRTRSYRISRLADITYLPNRFATKGFMAQGILVDIGDVPIESVTLATPGIPYLSSFTPAADVQNAARIDNDFLKGVTDGGFSYRRAVQLKENTTIVLRSAAYKGPSPRTYANVTYDEFEFDHRSDVIVVLRVVRVDADKSATIVWRLLEEKKPPSM